MEQYFDLDFDASMFDEEIEIEPNFSFGLSSQVASTPSCIPERTSSSSVGTIENFSLGLSSLEASTSSSCIPERTLSSVGTIEEFITEQKAKSTKYKEKSDIKTLETFFKSYGETRKVEQIPLDDLDRLLSEFFMKATRVDGHPFEPDTLNSIRNSLQRVLVDRGCKVDLKTSNEFATSRKVLVAKRKSLVKCGKGSKPNAARPLTDEEVDVLYEKGYFGTHEPEALQRTVWWCLSIQYGYRARDESRKLLWSDVSIGNEVDGTEYLVWECERGTKTRNGAQVNSFQRPFNPKAWAVGGPRCPVSIFKLYESHRPKEACTKESPFYLTIRREQSFNHMVDDCWYKDSPMGKNELGKFLSSARSLLPSRTGNRGRISNHSVRKTGITRLMEENIDPLLVKQISGHKRVESLLSYYTASTKQQKCMSRILCDSKNEVVSSSSPASSQVHFEVTPGTASTSTARNIPSEMSGIFSGATLNNCSFTFYHNNPSSAASSAESSNCDHVSKRARPNVIYDSDSD